MNNLPTVTPRQAFEELKKKDSPEAKAIINYVSDIENKNVVAIGTDNAFALTDQDGQIKAFKMELQLSVAEGTLVEIGKSFKNYIAPVAISAQGYEKWAEKTGASVIFPKDVMVGETLKPNPYMERDPDNKRVLTVHARAVAFKYSPMGLPQVCDWSTIFDVPSYRMIDLLAKAKRTPQAFKLLPEGMDPPAKNNETWAKYPFDEATNLWLNTSHNEVLDWFKSIINREKKAMDFAQTFARRNALKHLSGLQKPPENAHQWSFPVLSWRPTGNNIIKWDASQYSELQNRVAGVIEGNTGEFDQGDVKQIEVRKGVEKISEELDNQEIETDINPDDPAETIPEPASNHVEKQEQQPEPEPETTEELIEETKKVIEKERKQAITMQEIDPEAWSQSCESLGFISDPMKLTVEQCIKVGVKMNSIIDGDNE